MQILTQKKKKNFAEKITLFIYGYSVMVLSLLGGHDTYRTVSSRFRTAVGQDLFQGSLFEIFSGKT